MKSDDRKTVHRNTTTNFFMNLSRLKYADFTIFFIFFSINIPFDEEFKKIINKIEVNILRLFVYFQKS